MPKEQVKNVIIAGLLHDIGKSRIPENILNKEGQLLPDELEYMKKHTIIGYNMSKNIQGLKSSIRRAILMHHEREDGSGYPLGIKGPEIHIYAKIIAIADVFDDMTSEKLNKKGETPFNAFRQFRRIGLGQFDTSIMMTFLSNIANYYMGAKVRMNTGEIGDIVYLPPHSTSSPVVRIGDNYIDLSFDKAYEIVAMA